MRILISATNTSGPVMKGLAGDIASFKPAAIGAGLAIAAVGAALTYSVVQAANFQQGLNRLVTGAGDTTDNMTKLGQGILGVSVATGVLTTGNDGLLASMYLILSANQRGSQALATLKAAAQGAQIEQANLSDVTKALTTLQTNWGVSTFTAAQYMNGLIVAVAGGKITLEELTKFMAPILPIAKQMGISFADVAAAMSVQTNAGLKAAQSATGLQAVFVNIENPTHKAAAAMLKFGVDSVAVADEMKKSLPGAIQMLIDAALKVGPIGSVAFNRAMADMIGGGTRTAKTIDALTQHMKDWTNQVAAISAKMKLGATDVNGWALAQSGFNVQMDRAKAAVQAGAIAIGTLLLPYLTQILTVITPLITKFATWIVSMMQNKTAIAIFAGILAGLATIILAVVVPAIVSMIVAMWPILVAGAAVALVVVGLILLMQHWGQIMDWVGNKSEQMRIRVAENHAHMAIAADTATYVMAQKVIANLEKERAGVVAKLKETNDQTKKLQLEHELQTIDEQINGQNKRMALAKADQAKQIANLKTLHAQMLEAQKFFFVRWIDQLLSWIGDQMSKLGTMVKGWLDWTGRLVGGVMSTIGTFFHNFLSSMGTWIGNVMSNIGTFVHGIITWFQQLPGKLLQIGKDMIQGLINGIWSMVGNLASALGSMVHQAVGNIPGLGGILTGMHILGFQHGGMMPYTGLAYLHAGERVIPANQAGAGGHTFNNTFVFHVQQLDPREADRVAVLMADKLRAQMGNI